MATSEAGLEKYCHQHQHAIKVMAGDSLFLAAFDENTVVEMVESTLIATAWVNRAPLINAEARRLPDPELRDRISKLAQQVLEGWRQKGLEDALTDRFKAALAAR
jgi:hypothetical protein